MPVSSRWAASSRWGQAKLDALVTGCTAVYRDCGFVRGAAPGPGGR